MDWARRILHPDDFIPGFLPGKTEILPDLMEALVRQQEATWPLLVEARDRFRESRFRDISLGAFSVSAQYNPAREVSVSAAVDAESIRRRPCFLCPENLFAEEKGLAFGKDYALLLNPFPIFYPHFVASHRCHRPQNLSECAPVLLDLARQLEGRWSVLYNGPRCGASAPDHLHLQAFPRYSTPLETDLYHVDHKRRFARLRHSLWTDGRTSAFTVEGLGRTVLVLRGSEVNAMLDVLAHVMERHAAPGGEEALVNLVCWFEAGEWTLCVFPRRRHRPSFYGTEGGKILVSPGSIDLMGMFVTPRAVDFAALDEETARRIYAEVCLEEAELPRLLEGLPAGRPLFAGSPVREERAPDEPVLRVGLVESQPRVSFSLEGGWTVDGEDLPPGAYEATARAGKIRLEGAGHSLVSEGPLLLRPGKPEESRFTLHGVTFGIEFHWQRKADFTYEGEIELLAGEASTVTVVNRVALEAYLASVISSEMRADAPEEFLRAHAVISRSWVLAQLEARGEGRDFRPSDHPELPGRILSWTDRVRHTAFDVCSDDHCQRYQGVGRISREDVRRAVHDTRGLVLADGGEVCDARFSKCCGGVSEFFRTAWSDVNLRGLSPVRDLWMGGEVPRLDLEEGARAWIEGRPEACCGTQDPAVLRRILPDFDQETADFYRWEFTVSREELEETIRRKTGWDPGHLEALVPVHRGASGRLVQLLLVGTRGRLLLGKELEIRRALSTTHLYSSAFVVEVLPGDGGAVQAFRFRGAGWGHGVGLCQIGAAAMACEGRTHGQILGHYFPGTSLVRWYR